MHISLRIHRTQAIPEHINIRHFFSAGPPDHGPLDSPDVRRKTAAGHYEFLNGPTPPISVEMGKKSSGVGGLK